MPNGIGQLGGPSYGAIKDRVPQGVNDKLPTGVQNFDAKTAAEQNGMVNNIENKEFNKTTVALTGGFWAGFAGLCTWLNNTKFRGDYNDSLLGKIGKFGDNVTNGVKKTFKIGDGKGSVENGLKTSKNWLLDKFAFLKTPTKPLNTFAKSQANGIVSYTVSDIVGVIRTHIEDGGDFSKLFAKGTSKEAALDLLGKISNDPKASVKELDNLVTNLKNSNVAMETKKLMSFRLPFTKTRINIPNPKPFARTVTGQEAANKLTGVCGDFLEQNKGAVTKLGKGSTKTFAKTLEGLTNGYAGGKLMIVLQAFIFAQAVDKAVKAPKGEKFSTFMNEVTRDFGMFLTLPLQVKTLSQVGALKYTGMGKDLVNQKAAVGAFRDKLDDFNKLAKNGAFTDHKAYKTALKEVKGTLKAGSKWWQKPFKMVGNLFSTGLETPAAFRLTKEAAQNAKFSQKLLSVGSKFANQLKRKGGGFGRFAVAMFVVSPIIGKGIEKVSQKLFGKTTAAKEEEAKAKAEKEAKKQEKLNAQNPTGGLNMSQEELVKKLSENPELVARLQNDPKLMEQVAKNPALLVQMLSEPAAPQGARSSEANLSPALRERLAANGKTVPQHAQPPQAGGVQPMQPQPAAPQTQGAPTAAPMQNSQTQIPTTPAPNIQQSPNQAPAAAPVEPQRTYVPSSKAVAVNNTTTTPEQQGKLQDIYAKADRAEAEAMKYL